MALISPPARASSVCIKLQGLITHCSLWIKSLDTRGHVGFPDYIMFAPGLGAKTFQVWLPYIVLQVLRSALAPLLAKASTSFQLKALEAMLLMLEALLLMLIARDSYRENLSIHRLRNSIHYISGITHLAEPANSENHCGCIDKIAAPSLGPFQHSPSLVFMWRCIGLWERLR